MTDDPAKTAGRRIVEDRNVEGGKDEKDCSAHLIEWKRVIYQKNQK